MNERRSLVLAIIVTAILSALVTGGAVYGWQHAKVRSLGAEVDSLRRDLAESLGQLRSSDLARTQEVQPLAQRVSELESQVKQLREYPADGKVPPQLLKVYGALNGEAPSHMVIGYLVPVNPRLPLIDKMRVLADRVSQYSFDHLPIEVNGIVTQRGKRIATIDLREISGAVRPSWSGGFFEGSSGGGITQQTLVKTFLQDGYPGEWIDGVRFTYQGRSLSAGDHMDLSSVFYR